MIENNDQRVVKFNQYAEKYLDMEKISKYSLVNLFKVVNKGQKSYYNITSTINFQNLEKLPSSYYSIYYTKYSDTLTNIAYHFFGNINLWWILCKFNNITNPFKKLEQGTELRIPNQTIISSILQSLK